MLTWLHPLKLWSLQDSRRGSFLKAKPLQPEERKLKEAERKVGELTLENEVLRAAARKRGLQIPPRKRPR